MMKLMRLTIHLYFAIALVISVTRRASLASSVRVRILILSLMILINVDTGAKGESIMTISPLWTPAERLALIEVKSWRIYQLVDYMPSVEREKTIRDLSDQIRRLAGGDAVDLEASRDRLLEGLE